MDKDGMGNVKWGFREKSSKRREIDGAWTVEKAKNLNKEELFSFYKNLIIFINL